MARLSQKERERQEAAWRDEADRVRKLGDLFSTLPAGPQKAALWEAMSDRVIDLYNASHFERGDVLLEFLPNTYARKLLDWYFPDDENASLATPPPPIEEETPQPRQIQGGAQESVRTDGKRAREADIVEVAKDLVALWQNPNIQGLPRADRNAAIEDTRKRLIEAVSAL